MIENQAAFNLTLHSYNVDQLYFYPSPIQINIGDPQASFKISVPQDFEEGEYRLKWKIFGEKIPKIYTPIKDSRIVVVSKKELKIQIQMQQEFPFGGRTLPTKYTLELAPDIRVFLEVNMKKAY